MLRAVAVDLTLGATDQFVEAVGDLRERMDEKRMTAM